MQANPIRLIVKSTLATRIRQKMLLYVSKNNFIPANWHYGDRILVKGSPQELKPPANPGEFDFKRFLQFKNVSHQHFVKEDEVRLIAPTSRKGFIYYSYQAQAWSMKKLNEYVQGTDERAIAIALVLGVTDGIDNDLQSAYAAAGAMHLPRCVGDAYRDYLRNYSFLFKPLDRFKWSRWVVAIVSLVLLWTFSFVTGNSPSVLRAVTMFSFIALARPFGKRTSIYNTLAASVLLLLIYNPYLIMSVGFQLSYLAVLGIVYLQKPIYNLWQIENRIMDWVWKSSAVSIAAQLATFALSLLYFHQFPTYFLLSNMVVIPLSTLVLVVGIFLLAISFISPLASVTALILEWLVKALNWTVIKTETLPFSLINNIHITSFQCWLLMAILLAIILLFESRSVRWLYFSFGLTVVFVAIQWSHYFNAVDQPRMIVYSINKHQAMEFIDRGQSQFFCDSSLLSDTDKIKYHIQPNRVGRGVEITQLRMPVQCAVKGVRYFRWNNKTIGWMMSRNAELPVKVSIDYLIAGNNLLSRRKLKTAKVKEIIFDGSNSVRYLKIVSEIADSMKIQTYLTAEKGAFIF